MEYMLAHKQNIKMFHIKIFKNQTTTARTIYYAIPILYSKQKIKKIPKSIYWHINKHFCNDRFNVASKHETLQRCHV